MKRRWKVYRRVLLSGELPEKADLQLTKQGLSRAPGFVGVYNWNCTIEAETGEEAELLMKARLGNILDPYGIPWSTTKTSLLPEE